jgi:hypothetical protein
MAGNLVMVCQSTPRGTSLTASGPEIFRMDRGPLNYCIPKEFIRVSGKTVKSKAMDRLFTKMEPVTKVASVRAKSMEWVC